MTAQTTTSPTPAPAPPDTTYDVVVIGGGPAGMSAAITAARAGVRVAVIERNDSLGGILPQCIHNGFGALNFGADLPGPEYAWRYEQELRDLPITVMLDTTVVEMHGPATDHRPSLWAMNSRDGYMHLAPAAIVLAMGCRERTRAQIRLPGSRAAGIYTAGTVQRLVNVEGYMPARRVVMLGSGDIGMIMARRLTLEGAEVLRVIELLPYLTGLRRNYVQCLEDYGIPLHLSTTVNRIVGHDRVEAVETVHVDESLHPIRGTEEYIPCDTLVLSVGLIPENELSREAGVVLDPRTNGPVVDSGMATNVPGIFAAGNVTAIFDLVDWVSRAGEVAGASAAAWAARVTGSNPSARAANHGDATIEIVAGEGVSSIIPQRIRPGEKAVLTMRTSVQSDEVVAISLADEADSYVSFREPYARPAEMIVRELKEKEITALASARPARIVATIRPVRRGAPTDQRAGDGRNAAKAKEQA